ncbi:MAG: hypothetical protein RL670_1048, partial [Actinomycetota bacterium]
MSFATRLKALSSHPAVFLAVALVAQVLMVNWGAHDPKHPMGDVIYAYQPWVNYMLESGKAFGLNLTWVYPYPALAPILLAHLIAPTDYLLGWIELAIAVNMAALSLLVIRNRNAVKLGWYWLAATLALGPVALSRLDGISIAIALFGVAALLKRNAGVTAFWFTAATWLKVWPAALVATMASRVADRRRIFMVGGVTSLAFVALGYLLGGNGSMFSFITQQDARGLQIESVVAMPWVWRAVNHQNAVIYFDTHILAFQVRASGAAQAAAAMSWMMLAAVALTLAMTLVASWRQVRAEELMAQASLVLMLDLIVFNKVGSPQYLGWLIVPVLL